MYYFTGSGNTLKIAKQIQTVFIENNHECKLKNMESSLEKNDEIYTYIGLLFPVAIQSTFPLVWKFINNLPEVKNQKIFMVDTLESFSGGVVGPMKKILTLKGYDCIGAIEIKMSNSMQMNNKKIEFDQRKNIEAIKTATIFTNNLIAGKTEWKRIPILSDMMKAISKERSIWTKQSQKLKVDNNLCIMCGLCETNCPVNAISDSSGKIEINNSICESCMRCVNQCPKNAFRFGGKVIYQNK
jgi:ferredoxin/flavodoxin